MSWALAVLIRPNLMSDVASLHRELNVSAHTQAVLPSGVLLTIFNMMAVAEDVLKMILAIVGVIVLLYLFVSMYSATIERRREIATMRALGARRAGRSTGRHDNTARSWWPRGQSTRLRWPDQSW